MDPNKRTYAVDRTLYGNVSKPFSLGLSTFSPKIRLDDNKVVAYFGKTALDKVVDSETGESLSGSAYELPLDVKTTGYVYLTQLGVPPSEQEAAMLKWLALSPSLQASLVAQWNALDKNDTQAVSTFVMGVMSQLS